MSVAPDVSEPVMYLAIPPQCKKKGPVCNRLPPGPVGVSNSSSSTKSGSAAAKYVVKYAIVAAWISAPFSMGTDDSTEKPSKSTPTVADVGCAVLVGPSDMDGVPVEGVELGRGDNVCVMVGASVDGLTLGTLDNVSADGVGEGSGLSDGCSEGWPVLVGDVVIVGDEV